MNYVGYPTKLMEAVMIETNELEQIERIEELEEKIAPESQAGFLD